MLHRWTTQSPPSRATTQKAFSGTTIEMAAEEVVEGEEEVKGMEGLGEKGIIAGMAAPTSTRRAAVTLSALADV